MIFSDMKKTFLLILFISIIARSALSAQSFKVTPAKLEFILEAGELKTEEIIVLNSSDREESFVIGTADFSIDETGNTIFRSPGTTDRSCAKWMTVSPAFITLNPNESKKINVIMNVPDSVTNTRWGMVLVRSEKEFTGQAADLGAVRAGLIITPQIAVKVLQTPPHLNYKKISMDNFRETESKLTDSVRTFFVKVANEGEVFAKCKVYLTVSNLETLKEETFPPIEVPLLPEVKKDVKLILPNTIEPGFYSLAAILDYGDEYDLEGMEMEIEMLEEVKKE
jgi:hypothetical protein